MHRPPLATLFPYTTLFRSWTFWVPAATWKSRSVEVPGGISEGAPAGNEIDTGGGWPGYETLNWTLVGEPGLKRDRKSTRLNSSHRGISYAVFCLKKINMPS